MTAIKIDNQIIVDYLLGRLEEERGEEEILQIEERLYTEDTLYEQIQEAESELIDRYLDGQLKGDDKVQFESFFLRAPERKERLEFSRGLRTVTDEYLISLKETSAPAAKGASAGSFGVGARFIAWWESLASGSQLGLAAAACLLFLLAGGGWLYGRNSMLRDQLESATRSRRELEDKSRQQENQVASLRREKEDAQVKLDQARTELEALKSPSFFSTFSTILGRFLPGIASKGGEDIEYQKLRVPSSASFANLQFAPQTNRFNRYKISLLRIDGSERKEVHQIPSLAAPAKEGQRLSVRIPGKSLSNGRYALELTGVGDDNNTESVGEYRFEVRRTP